MAWNPKNHSKSTLYLRSYLFSCNELRPSWQNIYSNIIQQKRRRNLGFMLTFLCSSVDVNLFTISILFYFRLLAYDCLSLGISFDHLSQERRLYAEISLRTALLFSRSERSIWGQILAKWRVLIGGNCRKRFSAYRRPLLLINTIKFNL